MQRRCFLRLTLATLAWVSATAHTPYSQWAVYRKKHLLILTDKSRPGSFELGQQIAGLLAQYLPNSRARVTRAPDRQRIASLISTGQLDIALMPSEEAIALRSGQAPFADYGPVALRLLIATPNMLLVCREDLPKRHAYLVAKTLLEQNQAQALQFALPTAPAIPLHAGVIAYQQGEPEPEPPPAMLTDEPHQH